MMSKLLVFCLFSAILIHSLQSHSVDTAVKSALRKQYSKSRDTENRKKLLKAYEEFETHVNDKITSIINTLHQQNECESGGNETGTCRKRPETESQILHEDELTLDSLSERIENIHNILLALIPRKYPVFLLCSHELNLKTYLIFVFQLRPPHWELPLTPPTFLIPFCGPI